MNYQHLFKIQEEAGLSPEAFAKRLGVSGMTLRRWREKPEKEEIPLLYRSSLEKVLPQMVQEGLLSPKSESVLAFLDLSRIDWPTGCVFENLGIERPDGTTVLSNEEGWVLGLSQIGSQETKRELVDGQHTAIKGFAKMGKEWKRRISTLFLVVKSRRLTVMQKLVAYGAFFYLIHPWDFIPDHLPVFGLFDDYAVLGLAAMYYLKNYPNLFRHESPN